MSNKIKNEDNVVFIGGEMYIFGLIFKHKFNTPYFISDYLSIVQDTKINNPEQASKERCYRVFTKEM